MKVLKKYWKVVLSLLLLVAACAAYLGGYRPAKDEFERRQLQLQQETELLQATITQNIRYASVQDLLEPATAALAESRSALYESFPVELREEDQILYVLYLEELFGTEIQFSFGSVQPMVQLSDGAVLGGLTLTVNYQTDYDGYKKMIDYLAMDERITSVQYASMQYDEENNVVVGYLTLLCYTLSDGRAYDEPEVSEPAETGKDNPFA